MPVTNTVPNAQQGTNISDADAAVGNVLTPKTFYATATPKKTGTMPDSSYGTPVVPSTVQQQIAAGYHSGAGNDAVAGDADLVAGNIKSGVNIFGVDGTLSSGAATHDIEGSALGTLACNSNTWAMYYKLQSPDPGSDTVLATLTQVYAASVVEAYGFCLMRINAANSWKIRLYIDGVQVAENAYIASLSTLFILEEIKGYGTVAAGSKVVSVCAHNYSIVSNQLYICGRTNTSGCLSVAGVFAGSVKVV
jgi:hypothetical protein